MLKSDEVINGMDNFDYESLFPVLVEQNNLKMLLDWINFSYLEECGQNFAFFKDIKISPQMVELLYESKRLLPTNKHLLLNQLARSINLY